MKLSSSAEVVVIGSGVAGALVAYELARCGIDVLVLEAGPRIERAAVVSSFRASPEKGNYQAPYPAARHAPHPNYGLRGQDYLTLKGPDAASFRQQYLRVVGGTTWHWAAAAWRMLPNDFKMHSHYGVGVDWPIDYAELEPWYQLAEAQLGVSGPDDSTDLGSPRSQAYPMAALPLSWNDQRVGQILKRGGFVTVSEPVARNSVPYDGRPRCCGSNSCMPICPVAAMYGAIVHVDKAERAGARLIPNAVVYRLEANAGNRIVAAHYKDARGGSHRVTGQVFVLAANTIESTKILLLSSSARWPDGLANSSDQVGRNVMDHPQTGVKFMAAEPLWPGRGPQIMSAVTDFRDGDFRREEAAAKLGLSNQSRVEEATVEALQMGLLGAKLAAEIRRRAMHRVHIGAFHELLPDPDNRIRLCSHKDALGLPRPEITYAIASYTRQAGQRTKGAFARMASLLGGTDVEFSDSFSASNHAMGALRMGADSNSSVVDGDCRSHDHPNLFMSGGGVMASSGSSNPTLTIAALALRSANRIRRDLAAGPAKAVEPLQ